MRYINPFGRLFVAWLVLTVAGSQVFASGDGDKDTFGISFSSVDSSYDTAEIKVGGYKWTYPGGTEESGSDELELSRGSEYTVSIQGLSAIDPADNKVSICGGTTFTPGPYSLLSDKTDSLVWSAQDCSDITTEGPWYLKVFKFDEIQFTANELKTGGKCRATVGLNPEMRSLKWTITQKPEGLEYEIDGDDLILIAGCKIGTVEVMVQMTELPAVYATGSIEVVGCGAQCGFGNNNSGLNSLSASFSVGRGAWGESIGTIRLKSETPNQALSHPCALSFNVNRDDTEVIWEYRHMRQIRVPQGLVDIVADTNFFYTMSFYAEEAIGETNQAGQYTINAGHEPIVAYRIENPAHSLDDYDTLWLSEIHGSSTQKTVYTWAETNSTWTMEKDGGAVLETLSKEYVTEGSNEFQIVRHDTLDASEQSVYATESTYQLYSTGRQLIKSVVDPDGLALTSSNEYILITNSAAGLAYPLPSRSFESDGQWEEFLYDASGKMTNQISAWKESESGDSSAIIRREVLDYASVDPLDTLAVRSNSARTISVYIGDVLIGWSYQAYYANSEGNLVSVSEEAASQGAAYGDAGNDRTETTSYSYEEANGFLAGRVLQAASSDGRLALYQYERGTLHTNQTPSQIDFTSDTTGRWMRVIVDNVTTGNVSGLAGQSTREVAISDYLGNPVLAETYIYDGQDFSSRINWAYTEYNSLGKPLRVYDQTGLTQETTWSPSGCCGKESEVDPAGMETYFTYDSVTKRLLSTARTAADGSTNLITDYTYDELGNLLQTQISAGGLSQVTSNAYDAAGRLVNSYDVARIETEYQYESGGRLRRSIRAGLTNETMAFLDGRSATSEGNGDFTQTYDYGVNADGAQWTQVYSGPDGTNSVAWAKITRDMLGRTIREEKPGFQGDLAEVPVLTTTRHYDSKGQLTNSVSFVAVGAQVENQVSTLYSYDDSGRPYRTGLDLNSNGIMDLDGPDRVSEQVALIEETSGDWWNISKSITYPYDSSAVPVTNRISMRKLTGLGGTLQGRGIQTAEELSIDHLGNQSVSQTWNDRDNKTVIQVMDIPTSTQSLYRTTVNGVLIEEISAAGITTTNGYDALGRQIGVYTESDGGNRLVGQVTAFNALGQVASITDAAGYQTTNVYDSATGRRTAVTDALTNTVYTAYDVQGRVTNTWGATYPVAYEYDDYGRMTVLKTWRDTNSAPDITQWFFDEATGLLTNKVYADGNGPSYEYDATGRLTKRTWARGIETAYTNNILGQLTGIDYSDSTPDVSFAYDRQGRQLTITDTLGTRTNVYDAFTLLEEQMPDGSVLARSYDTFGRSLGLSLDNGYELAYAYNEIGRFASITSAMLSATTTVDYAYLPGSGLLSGWTIQDGTGTNQVVTVSKAYESHRDLIASVVNTGSVALISQFDYVNDAIGRRTLRVDADSTTNAFGYNTRSELIDALMGTNQFAYAYDPIGNRISATNGGIATAYIANQLNQYSSISNDLPSTVASLQYDADGNLTNNGTLSYVWDAENRLLEVTSNGVVRLQNTYDYMGRRIQKVAGSATNQFVYDGWNMLQETRGSALYSYVWGLDLSGSLQDAGGIGGLTARIHHLVSGTNLTLNSSEYYVADANGNITDFIYATVLGTSYSYTYDPYGNALGVMNPTRKDRKFRFSSKYCDDETGLTYYGYRFYAPCLGRWCSTDPIEERGGLNLYAFVANDPANRLDAKGAWSWKYNSAIQEVRSTYLSWSPSYPFASRLMKYWLEQNIIILGTSASMLDYIPSGADIAEVKIHGKQKIKYVIDNELAVAFFPHVYFTPSPVDMDWIPVVDDANMWRAYGGAELSFSSFNIEYPWSMGAVPVIKGTFQIHLFDQYSWKSKLASMHPTYSAAKWLQDNCEFEVFNHTMDFIYDFN